MSSFLDRKNPNEEWVKQKLREHQVAQIKSKIDQQNTMQWLAGAENKVEERLHDEEIDEITGGASNAENPLFKVAIASIVILVIIVIWNRL